MASVDETKSSVTSANRVTNHSHGHSTHKQVIVYLGEAVKMWKSVCVVRHVCCKYFQVAFKTWPAINFWQMEVCRTWSKSGVG
jgi:hypothetical protein